MSKKLQTNNSEAGNGIEKAKVGTPRCLSIAQSGIGTASQFASFMSNLISDLITGDISPQVGNAAVNAGGKLLKVVEMQYRYGKPGPDGSLRTLDLIG